jgi:tetratricopeptide (TPR) repeat protein
MNRFTRRRSGSPGARVGSLVLAALFLALGPSPDARGQLVTPDLEQTQVGTHAHDYFAQYTDPSTATLLHTVEQYHLSESFWRFYREGAFNSARSDLDYVLAYFPNHPRALHLIAYDDNVKSPISVVIQRFETAIHAYPDHAYTVAQYGRYLLSIGRKNAGLALLNEAIRIDPTLVIARAWLEEAQGKLQQSQMERPRNATRGGAPAPTSKEPRARKR